MLIAGLLLAHHFRFEILYLCHRRLLRSAAEPHGVPPRLLAAVVWQESRFRARSLGPAGEIGLMQIMPSAAGEWARAVGVTNLAPTDLLAPRTNLMAGAWYLGRALQRWREQTDPEACALAEYNAGPANAARWARAADRTGKPFVEQIDYPATRRYVIEVLRRYRGR